MSLAVILLVDDEVPFVETMTKRLTKRNLTVLSAFSGKEGLEKLKEHAEIDVVILDVKMPGLDGLEALRVIKKTHPLVEVIILTGHASAETAVEALSLGAFDYLVKPCDVSTLLKKANEAYDRKKAAETDDTER